jgi:hypothetical protein
VPTTAEIDDFDHAVGDLQTLAVSALVASWADEIAQAEGETVKAVQALMVEIAAEYAQAAAATATDFYSSVRPAGSPKFIPAPILRADPFGPGSRNWATKPLLLESPEEAMRRVAAEVMLSVKQAAIETLGEATTDDPIDARFARFPTNPDPCSYCVLRASRGAVYWSEESATKGDHLKCGCKATVIFTGEDLPYQRKPYMAQYQAGSSAATDAIVAIRANKALTPAERRDRELKALLAGMRRANGTR